MNRKSSVHVAVLLALAASAAPGDASYSPPTFWHDPAPAGSAPPPRIASPGPAPRETTRRGDSVTSPLTRSDRLVGFFTFVSASASHPASLNTILEQRLELDAETAARVVAFAKTYPDEGRAATAARWAKLCDVLRSTRTDGEVGEWMEQRAAEDARARDAQFERFLASLDPATVERIERWIDEDLRPGMGHTDVDARRFLTQPGARAAVTREACAGTPQADDATASR
jgi:hypothetical protein